MTGWPQLEHPVVVAPMAGGPTTPELVAAACAAGGTGFLAGGYRAPDDVREQIRRTRELTDRPFGVNIFVPGRLDRSAVEQDVRRYADLLAPVARDLGVDVPGPRWDDDDAYDAKVDVALAERVSLVSFTFGVPTSDVVDALHAAGACVLVTVTDVDEATAAARSGADLLVAQGAAAGGHRGTHDVDTIPSDLQWPDLLRQSRTVTSLPVLVAGGIRGPRDVRLAHQLGAVAVQCGTAFLLADEAGTNPAYRTALQDPSYESTVVTRAFSGRPARGLRNEFIDRYDESAPSAYPVVNDLTASLRAAATGRRDPRHLALWAGTGWRQARPGQAGQILHDLCGQPPSPSVGAP